ncbi:Ca2+/calmodulin-dependent protein kinase, EF-Hand protein superfamily [Handroanthus impetiginosus]|uniref:Ca2+/calmodulin-dependent protein kinase, EF-Hand protein superfamily n=1 Tax=Handroanthus impetiginosus TaxID=429701 RepID=A0A2G9H5T4_9LAMI|nr:Ca2+/calmodulin-dependent protein kinase, EF-Hand protein superfamily [Handroanthus impetiginosus]
MGISELEFKRHMDTVGNVRHENVVALRAYYSSKHEKLMMYDYYSKGSVFALLHGQTGENRAHVDWATRLTIAIGAARGISEIHKQTGGELVHGNIKSSNIFLNPQHYGYVSDLGLANMTETTFMPTAQCYAPEIKGTRNVSQASNVYSFGILLLELLTRESPEPLPGGPDPVDLVKLASIFDEDLLKYPSIKKGMVKLLDIRTKCVSKSAKKRPKMSVVVKMLDDICKVNPVIRLPFERKLVDADPTFDLENLLFVEVLATGPFGTHYKARQKNGNTIMVMILRYVPTAFEKFKQHMEVIGGIWHENIVELRAYNLSTYENFLVYNYYNQGSVFAALLVGAARGVAHIHRQDGGKLVHESIESSTIFINDENHGVSPGYCAPEVIDTNEVSQASDVYCFGVVLLELLTGKPSQDTTNDGGVIFSLVDRIKFVLLDELTAEMFDVQLLRYPHDKEAMVQVLQIALDCVAIVPERRPRMPEIVKMLEEISGFGPSHRSSLEHVLEHKCIESRLEDLLEDLLPKLTS